MAVVPSDLRVSPTAMGILSSQKVSDAGNVSLLEYVKTNCLSNTVNGKPLNIQQVKWLAGLGASGKERMAAYTNSEAYVRFPVVPLVPQQLVVGDISQSVSYMGRIGQVETIYPETVAYSDFAL
jgi:hypothetical protein